MIKPGASVCAVFHSPDGYVPGAPLAASFDIAALVTVEEISEALEYTTHADGSHGVPNWRDCDEVLVSYGGNTSPQEEIRSTRIGDVIVRLTRDTDGPGVFSELFLHTPDGFAFLGFGDMGSDGAKLLARRACGEARLNDLIPASGKI